MTSYRLRPNLILLALGVALWGCAAAPVSGWQEFGVLFGTVLDARQEPLGGALVSLSGTDVRVATDDGGNFVVPNLPAGPYSVRAELDGYVAVVEQVDVPSGSAVSVRLELFAMGAVLNELRVRVPQGDRRAGSAEGVAGGHEGLQTAADLLAQSLPGLLVDPGNGMAGGGARVVIRGPKSITLSTHPSIYLDGVRLHAGGAPGARAFQVLSQIPASEVREIKVLRGPAATAMYGDSSAGVVLIETRQGSRRTNGP